MRKVSYFVLFLSLTGLLLAGCGSGAPTQEPSGEPAGSGSLVPVTQVTNWYAQADQGGQYAALEKGFYEEAGLDMTIEPGGPKVSTIQVVSSGRAQFGMAQADQLLMARADGIPVVAVAALFQVSPQIILFQKGQPIDGFDDLNGRTVYVTPGSPYWEYLKQTYKLDRVRELAFTGEFSGLLSDASSASQAYLNTAPFTLKSQGIDTGHLLIYDSGYQPYSNVLFTTESYLEENPEAVKAFVEASVTGWDYYKTEYEEINQALLEANPNLDLETLKFGAESQTELIYGYDAAGLGVGTMSESRWSALMEQMLETGLLKEELDISQAYTTAFLPSADSE